MLDGTLSAARRVSLADFRRSESQNGNLRGVKNDTESDRREFAVPIVTIFGIAAAMPRERVGDRLFRKKAVLPTCSYPNRHDMMRALGSGVCFGLAGFSLDGSGHMPGIES
ncbi:hypothetical protein [Sinisalibacter aestuarii]|uniref:hypothetical protein n=1 Tax=Sinisalibacter aestuarii TaxID=2949426 RepID=UPI002493AECC|nr:hypothetical protein [Sinisalibacter aestuarii]